MRGGGGVGAWGGSNMKKSCRHESQRKKFVENVGGKKSILTKFIKKYVDQNKPNGNVDNREDIMKYLIFPFFNEA